MSLVSIPLSSWANSYEDGVTMGEVSDGQGERVTDEKRAQRLKSPKQTDSVKL